MTIRTFSLLGDAPSLVDSLEVFLVQALKMSRELLHHMDLLIENEHHHSKLLDNVMRFSKQCAL